MIIAPGLHLHVFPTIKMQFNYLSQVTAFLPFIAQSTNRSPNHDQTHRKTDVFLRRKSSVDAMTPIIEEEVVSNPFDKNVTAQNSDNASILNRGENMNQRFNNRQEDAYFRGHSSSKSANTQQQQSTSSNSSSGSQLCSDDGSLIDMDDVQHDDFVIL